MTGYTAEELSHMTLEKWFDQEDRIKVTAAVREVFEKGHGEVEASLILKNGEKMMIRSSGAPLTLDGYKYFAGIGMDITERKNLEIKLKRNMTDLLESQRIAHLGTWRMDLATNQVIWSEELYKMYGFDPTIPPPSYAEHIKLFTLESWEKLSASFEQTRTAGIPYELELKTILKDGSNGWMWVQGEAEKDSNGNITGLRGAAQDITKRKHTENILEENRVLNESIINSTSDAIYAKNAKGQYLLFNDAAAKVTGKSASDVIGKDDRFLFPENEALMIMDGDKKIIQKKEILTYEETVTNPFGKIITFLSTKGPIYNKDKEVIGLFGVARDITQRKQTEEELQQSKERFQMLFENSGLGIGYYTADGILISYNQRALNDIGGNLEDYIGKSTSELFPKEESEIYLERIEKATLCDKPQEYEDCLVLDAIPKWFSSTFTRVKNISGEVMGVQIATLDITEKRQAEENIKKQNELVSTLLELLPVGVFMVNAEDGKPLAANAMAMTLLGRGILPNANEHNLSEVYKAYIKDTNKIYPPTKMPIVLGMKGIVSHIDNMVVKRKDGTKVLLEVFGTPVKDEQGKPWASLVTFLDITERKKAEDNLIYLNNHDYLTGLNNRRYFEEAIKRLDIERKLPLSIIMADVNGLKIINDSFGHDMGDELLKKAASTITKACRGRGVIVRYGGDEFVALLPNTSHNEATQIANLIKELAAKEKVANIELSVSYGYDTKDSMNKSIMEVLANAENHMYAHKLSERSSMRSKTIDIIMNTLFEKSNREANHSKRVSRICEQIAIQMKFEKQEVNQMKIAGLVHDIGKISIDEKILNKPGRLDDGEKIEIQKHPESGWRILSSSNEFENMAKLVLQHHEQWDGNGYPNKLIGEKISIEARIIAVADAYDAMTSKRSYRAAMSNEEAIKEILRCSGTQFDPEIVDVFVNKVLTVNSDFK